MCGTLLRPFDGPLVTRIVLGDYYKLLTMIVLTLTANVPSTERRVLQKQIKFVRPFVRGKVKKTWFVKRSICQGFRTTVGGNSMRGARIEGPITHRTPLVGWEPMKIEFARNKLVWGISMRRTWIQDPKTLKQLSRSKNIGWDWEKSNEKLIFKDNI